MASKRTVHAGVAPLLIRSVAFMHAACHNVTKLKSGKERLDIPRLTEADVELLENEIDAMERTLPPMTHFILPGGHQTVSFCHIARCVCRRAERHVVHLHDIEPVDTVILRYLNRLSDYLFVLARMLAAALSAEELKWVPEHGKS